MTRPELCVWRDAGGAVQHAAVTLGDGWALHKPSQGWMSPTKVLTVRDAMLSARVRGHHVQRRTLLPDRRRQVLEPASSARIDGEPHTAAGLLAVIRHIAAVM